MTWSDFFGSFPLSFEEGLTLFLLVMMRLAPIVALAPFLGSKVMPLPNKAGLMIVLTLFFLPIVSSKMGRALTFNEIFIVMAIKELFVGALIGFLITIPFYIAQFSGVLIDYLRGASIMQAQDPLLQSQASPIGIMYNYLMIFLFFMIDGPFHLFDGLCHAYIILPPDKLLPLSFFAESAPVWGQLSELVHQLVRIGIQITAPTLLAVLMAEMFLGIANRLAPQVQIAFLGMSLKSFLGLGVMWAGWYVILHQLSNQSIEWFQFIDRVIDAFA